MVVTGIVAIALVLFGIRWLDGLRVPEIVRGATARGGWVGICPDPRYWHPPETEEAISPEFNARLAKRFPPGSSEQVLIDTLKAEGFGAPQECDFDRTIKFIEFRLNGNEVVALAYWKAESTKKIVWTKGLVEYTFL